MALDVAVLAATVVSKFLFPYVKSGVGKIAEAVGERFSEAAAEHATTLASTLWGRVKGLFASPKEQSKLELFEDEPDEYLAGVEKTLREKLAADPQLAHELQDLIDAPSPDGAGSGAQIMNASIAGIVDLRGAHVEGGQHSGVRIEHFSAPVNAPPRAATPRPPDRP